MLRLTTKYGLCLGLLAGSFQAAYGFSLLGPINQAWQTQDIGYQLPGDLGTPKNLGEEYRKNTPVIYYAADANFLDFFGSNGLHEIDAAMGMFNCLSNVSSFSRELTEFPLNTTRRNARAQALSLVDLKSFTMQLLMEQMGLAEPIRFMWGIHDRGLLPNTGCPQGMSYTIVKRNFDPVFGTSLDQLKTSSYINGVLYSYEVLEYCTTPVPPVALAYAFPVDPAADANTPVAEIAGFGNSLFLDPYGLFYTGLTRDDVGGLRYLLRADNFNTENAAPNTQEFVTNDVPQLLVSSNLTLLAAQALTNNAAALQTLYPNLTIISSSNWFQNAYITNTVLYFTNYPWDPLGTPAHLIVTTNLTPTVLTLYQHTFANVLRIVPNGHGGWSLVPMTSIPKDNGRSFVTLETTSVAVSNNPWAPLGGTFVATNITDYTYTTNDVIGDFLILPAAWCDALVISPQLTNVVTVTNAVAVATNFVTGVQTNAGAVISYNVNEITYFTNHTFVVMPVFCASNSVALRGGVEKITFIRRDFDSLFSRLFVPITNEYYVNVLTNYAIVPRWTQRVITTPDLLFSAAEDPFTGMINGAPRVQLGGRNLNFVAGPGGGGLAGPGTLDNPTSITFNKVGEIEYIQGLAGLSDTNAFLGELNAIPIWMWGSYDGRTNAPVVYPNDISVLNLENMALIQVSPAGLDNAIAFQSYYQELQCTASTPNWQFPCTWSLAPGSPGLPPGLGIGTASNGIGTISGAPQASGFYDFIIRVTDAQGRTLDRSYSIRVSPSS